MFSETSKILIHNLGIEQGNNNNIGKKYVRKDHPYYTL